ncbi:hypothetical protein [Streptomyces sp. NPDC059928]|uniref:hypothetical protein n=1 Tax=unclassified Streptomyces TaxID=2593676 RepID=UPI00364C3950
MSDHPQGAQIDDGSAPGEDPFEEIGTEDGFLEHEEPDLLKQHRKLLESEGYRAVSLMDRVKRIAFVFQGNAAQYLALVSKLQDPGFSLPIMDVRNPAAHDDLLSEAERLLHNVLTGMSTRIDQQRNFMRRYFSDDAALTSEHRERISSVFIGDLQATFMKDLRNYITHDQLPVAQSSQAFSSQAISITLILPSGPLLTWKSWSSGVKEWIMSCGEAVPIVDVVDGYARKAAAVDEWLFSRIASKYASEIRDFRQAQAAYMSEYSRVFGV